MSSIDESVLYRLKNLNNDNIISVFKDQFRMGRASTNDLSIANNRYISSCHCLFEFEHGHLYLSDTSSNGTLINRSTKVGRDEPRVELKSGDIVHLVFRKDTPEANVVFQMDIPVSIQPEQPSVNANSPFDEDTQLATYPSIPPISPEKTPENADLSELMNCSTNLELELPPNLVQQEAKREFAMDASDDMEDVLTCVCCQDIMTNPVTLEPCLHAFCSDCYASWEAVQRTCPKCRVKVIGKKKNVVINGILEAYLKAFPHKRPESKLAEGHDQSKPTHERHQVGPDGMYLFNTQYHHMGDDEDEDEAMDDDDDNEDEDEDDDDDDGNQGYVAPMIAPPVRNAQFHCRQCPGPFAAAVGPGGFQCPVGQNHILCQCCLQPMADRRDEANIHQHCQICHQFFCNMYFQKCQRADCLGCLTRLRDCRFAPRHLVNLVNDNPVESQVVQDYLANNQMDMRDLLVHCCDRLDRNEFHCPTIDRTAAVPSSKAVCYKCGLKVFKDLAYQFRAQMKLADISSIALRHRDNCHYGKRCRTQYSKPVHAAKFNHACEQTKF